MGIAKQAAMLRAARNSASIRSYHPSVTAWRCMPSPFGADGIAHVPDFQVFDEDGSTLYLDAPDRVVSVDATVIAAEARRTALVKHGVLATEVRTNPRTRRRQAYVQLKTINAFLDSHRSLHRIASGWRRNIAWMKDELDQHGLEPIFKTSGKIARYYRMEDLAKAGLLPPNP